MFRVEQRIAPVHAEHIELRVDPETHRPVELRRWQIVDGERSAMYATFAIDYPEQGAEDIYALGAPGNVPVLDVRDMQTYFVERDWPEPADYEAIVYRTPTGVHQLKVVGDGMRFRHNDAGTSVEKVDFEEWYTVLNLNGSQPQSIEWWADEVSRARMNYHQPNTDRELLQHRLLFGTFSSHVNGQPVQSYLYGGPSDFVSVHTETSLAGLEGTIELRGPERSVWLDPQRDMIVRRSERVVDDEFSPVKVTQFDEVQQGPADVWFPRRWRQGRVAERGNELDNTFRGSSVLNTQLWVAEIEFGEG